MNIIKLTVCWVCILSAVITQAATDPRFQRYDKNSDGKITPEELGMAAVFKAADANGDGVITPDEFTATMNSRRGGRQTGSPEASQAAESVKPIEVRYAETPGVEANAQSLDIYAPNNPTIAPVMMYVHGGGWRKGDKRSLAAAPGFFNGQGFIFVSINYRLLPSGKHPNNVADVARAIAWVHDNIARYGGDPSQLFLYGHSAGAHLVALVATDDRHLKAAGKSLAVLQGVIPLDTNAYDIPRLTAGKAADNIFVGAFGTDPAVQKDASPIAHAVPGKEIPPMLVFHSNSGSGSRNAQGTAFVEALKAADVDAELIPSMKQNHGEINRQFGTPGDMVTEAAMKFIHRYRTGAKSADAPKSPAETSATLPSGTTMHEWVKAYAAFGEHRAASEVDRKTSEWLAARLREAGLKVEFQEFTVPQFQLKETKLRIGSQNIDAFPQWPVGATATPISAPLTLSSAATVRERIVLVEAERESRRSGEALVQRLASAGAVAAILVTASPEGVLRAQNVPRPDVPPPSIPVVVVGSAHRDLLRRAVDQGEAAELAVAGEFQPQAKARNVVATLERGPKRIVVSTPYSGWFQCGGERGSGLAVFLSLARWAAQSGEKHSFTFTANSAHELGYAGMRAFLDSAAPKPESVVCWLHLGANVALLPEARPADGNRPTLLFTTNPAWTTMLTEAFRDVPRVRVSADRRPAGELALVVPKGYPCLNLAGGGNRWMHSPKDGPETTSPAVLEPLLRALVTVLQTIESRNPL
jgi:acetyl esterase/lipase